MLFAPSLPAASLALSALFLSVTATPLQARQTTYNVTCGATVTTAYCVVSFFLGCSNTGEIRIDEGHPHPGYLSGENCEDCSCKAIAPALLPPPAPEPSFIPAPPPAPAPAPSCVGTIHANPAAQGALPIPNQDWCTRPEVNAVCDAGKVNVLGEDQWNVCKLRCKC